jgi:hypothetical protein
MHPERNPSKNRVAETVEGDSEEGPRLLARITFSRHEETDYTGIGRDITDRGLARAQEKGRQITREKGVPAIIGAQEVGDARKQRLIRIPGLRSSDIRDDERFARLAEDLGPTQEVWADAHYYRPEFYDNPNVLETNEEKRTRMYRELERLVSFLEKEKSTHSEVPHLVFVSHFELISLLLDDVFGIKTFVSANTPSFGQHVDLEVFEPLRDGNVPIAIHFDGRATRVLFDRELRRLVAEPAI